VTKFAQQYVNCTLRVQFVRKGRELSWTVSAVGADPKDRTKELPIPFYDGRRMGGGPSTSDWVSYAKRVVHIDSVQWVLARQELSEEGALVSAPVRIRFGPSPEQHAERLHGLLVGLMDWIVPPGDVACVECWPDFDQLVEFRDAYAAAVDELAKWAAKPPPPEAP
jgi:hypothetical protein